MAVFQVLTNDDREISGGAVHTGKVIHNYPEHQIPNHLNVSGTNKKKVKRVATHINEEHVMSMNTAFVFLTLLMVSAVAGTACVSPSSPVSPASPVPALTTVKVAYQPTTSFGPIFIAKDEGFFARQGINVEFVKLTGFSMALPLLISGDAAVTSGPLSSGMINSLAKGAHIRIVADKGTITPGFCTGVAILVRKDLYDNGTVRNISDLKGRKLMGTSGSNDNSYTLIRALALGNLSMNDVEIVQMDYPSGIVAFKNRAIDAGMFTEPYVTQALNSGSAVVLSPAQEFVPGYSIPLFYGPAFLDKDPDLGRRFMVAYLQGVKQYNKGKTEQNLAIMGNYTSLDRELLNQSCWYPVREDGYVSRQPNRETMNWMYANKAITRIPDDDQLYDMSYVDYANGVLLNTTSSG
jgi:NitT/TauT family transport system substrate-binding protein